MTYANMNYEMVLRHLESKELLLNKIISLPLLKTKNGILKEKQKNKIEHAQIFLKEIKKIHDYVEIILDVHIVSWDMMKQLEKKCDFSEIVFDGKFSKLMRISSFPFRDTWILFVPSLSAL